MQSKIVFLLIILFIGVACGNRKEKALLGQWQGVALLEEGDSLLYGEVRMSQSPFHRGSDFNIRKCEILGETFYK